MGCFRLHTESESTLRVAYSKKLEKPLKKTVHYYPFGLKMKGFNSTTTAGGNDVAQKFKYNGVELEESLGLNLYEMDLRLYNPEIGRFNGIDPVTHHSGADGECYTCIDSGSDGGYLNNLGRLGVQNKIEREVLRYNDPEPDPEPSLGSFEMALIFAGAGDIVDQQRQGTVYGAPQVLGALMSEDTKDFMKKISFIIGTMAAYTGTTSFILGMPGAFPGTYVKTYNKYSTTGKSFYMHNPNVVYNDAMAKYKSNAGGSSYLGNILAYGSMGLSLYSYATDPNYGYAFGGGKYAREYELFFDLAMTRLGMSPNPFLIGTSLFYFYVAKPAAIEAQYEIDTKYGGDRKKYRAVNMMNYNRFYEN